MSTGADVTAGLDPSAREAETAALERLLAEDPAAALTRARELHPAELAAALASLESGDRAALIDGLGVDELAPFIAYLDPRHRTAVYRDRTPGELGALASRLPDDLVADMVQSLEPEVADSVVEALSARAGARLRAMVAHAPDTAAGRMTGQVFSVRLDRTVEQVIDALRQRRPEAHRPFYTYVTDAAGRLVGIVGFNALLFAEPDTPISSLMTEAASVPADMDDVEAARLLQRRKVLALPVVDADQRLLGALTIDDTVDVLEEAATDDMLHLAGVGEDEALESVRDSIRYRLPWLAMNLVALLLAAWVISLFESTIAQVAVIAVFLPVVLGQGGNGGLQTVTVVVRSLALGRIAPRNTMRVTGNELAAAFITGGAVGASVGLLAWIWRDNLWLGLVVGTAILANQLVGAVAGVCFPMGLQKIRQDPAVSAPIWLTNATDVLGALLLLGLASLLISHL